MISKWGKPTEHPLMVTDGRKLSETSVMSPSSASSVADSNFTFNTYSDSKSEGQSSPSILTNKTNTLRNLEKYMLPHFLPNFPA